MSINSAMLAGVSGLVANSSALAAISDNIANVNTVAYKRAQVNFANVVTSQSLTGRYSAGGVQGITRQYVGQQGLIQSATSTTDLAIVGDGFFVVSNKGAGLTAADTRTFTRAGSFNTALLRAAIGRSADDAHVDTGVLPLIATSSAMLESASNELV